MIYVYLPGPKITAPKITGNMGSPDGYKQLCNLFTFVAGDSEVRFNPPLRASPKPLAKMQKDITFDQIASHRQFSLQNNYQKLKAMNKHLLLTTIIFTLTLAYNKIAAQGTWTQKANFGGVARYGCGSFSIGTKGYIGCGFNGTTNYNDFWEWNSLTNTWTQKANFGGAGRQYPRGLSIGNKGYMGTGWNNVTNTYYNDFWEYDTLANTWTQKANFGGLPRLAAVAFSIGNKGYLGTGNGSGVWYSDFWEYNPSTDTWTQKQNFGGGNRRGAVGFAIAGKGYIGTGENSGVRYKDFWEYDTLTNVWTQKANVSTNNRWSGAGFAAGGLGYLGTGTDFGPNFSDFWEYNPSLNTWTQVASFGPGTRKNATGFSIGNKGYVGTGSGSSPYYNDFWEYSPAPTSINDKNIESNIFIYPNPFSSQTVLHTDNLLHNATIMIVNCFGQTVAQLKSLSGETIVLNRDNLSSGLYFVRLIQNNQVIATKKITIAD